MFNPLVRLCLTVALLGSLSIQGRSAAAEAQSRYYLSLGDSIALGTGASAPARTYTEQVHAFLRDFRRFTFGVNMAVSGESSGEFINDGQLANALNQINNPGNDAAVVTLSLGGNDLLQLLKPGEACNDPSSPGCPVAVQTALTTFSTNYTSILDQLQAALAADGGENRLLVLTYYNPFSGTGSEYEAAMDVILLGSDGRIDCAPVEENRSFTALGLNDRITCLAAARGATVVDIYPLFAGRGLELTHIGALDVHPNDRGYAAISRALLAQLGFVSTFLPVAQR